MTTGTTDVVSNFLETHDLGPVDDKSQIPLHHPLLSPSDTPLQTLLPRSVWPLSGGDTSLKGR